MSTTDDQPTPAAELAPDADAALDAEIAANLAERAAKHYRRAQVATSRDLAHTHTHWADKFTAIAEDFEASAYAATDPASSLDYAARARDDAARARAVAEAAFAVYEDVAEWQFRALGRGGKRVTKWVIAWLARLWRLPVNPLYGPNEMARMVFLMVAAGFLAFLWNNTLDYWRSLSEVYGYL